MSRGVRSWWVALVVALTAVVLYAPTLGYDLVWDDPALVALVEGAYREGGLAAVARAEFRIDPREPTGYYRPVVLLSLWADGVIGGGSATAYHATNVMLHAAGTLLFTLVVATLARSRRAAAAAGVLFAVHPVHVEPVVFVAGRTDLWAGLFVFGAALAWARGREAAGPARAVLIVASGAAVALGGLSKEFALVLPAALLAWEMMFPREPSDRRWPRRLAPWIAAWSGGVAVAIAARAASGIAYPAGQLSLTRPPFVTDPTLMPQVFTKMLALYAVPWPLSASWERYQLDWSLGTVAAAALGVAVFAASGRVVGWRTAGAGAVWSVLFMVPVSGVVPLGSATFAERYLYVPSGGFCLAAGSLAGASRIGWRARGAALVAVTLLFGLVSASRAGVWKNEVSLFESLVASAPANSALWDNLGQAYDAAGRMDDAVRAYHEALKLDPGRASAWNSLGVAWGRQGQFARAAQALREAIRLDPTMPHPRFNLALLCLSMGDHGCVEEQRWALRTLAPDAAERLTQVIRRGR